MKNKDFLENFKKIWERVKYWQIGAIVGGLVPIVALFVGQIFAIGTNISTSFFSYLMLFPFGLPPFTTGSPDAAALIILIFNIFVWIIMGAVVGYIAERYWKTTIITTESKSGKGGGK